MTCNVCGIKEAVGVCASGLGPASFAYCSTCLDSNAEPSTMLDWVFEDCGDNVVPEVRNVKTFFTGRYWTWAEYVNRPK